MTVPVMQVISAFLEDPQAKRYGAELIRATHLQSGTLYPILARLERNGWLVSQKEAIDPKKEGRPARRYYELSPDGAAPMRQARAEIHEALKKIESPAIGWGKPEAHPA